MRISDWSSDVCSSDLRSVEAARGDTEAAEANADAVRVIVAADTTQAYADAASGAARLDVARRIVGLLGQQVKLTHRRKEVGLATGLDPAPLNTLRHPPAPDPPPTHAPTQAPHGTP